jgi:transposase-like protein
MNDVSESKNSMMDLWQESIRRNAQQRTTVTPKDIVGQKAELLRRIQSGEIECPTCEGRQFKDQSGDAGVSFSAPQGMNSALATLTVLSHEHEHVSHAKADARDKFDEAVVHTSVGTEKCVCPLCGRTYISGGFAKTQVNPNTSPEMDMLAKRREELERIISPFSTFNAKA